ncbi:hypothetical protein GCM10028805_54570 [Spirosoma harenae]
MIEYHQAIHYEWLYQRLLQRWLLFPAQHIVELAAAESQHDQPATAQLLERVRANLLRLIEHIGPGRTSGQGLAYFYSAIREVASYSGVCQLIAEIDELAKQEVRLD